MQSSGDAGVRNLIAKSQLSTYRQTFLVLASTTWIPSLIVDQREAN